MTTNPADTAPTSDPAVDFSSATDISQAVPPAAESSPLTALESALFGLVKQQQACIIALAEQVRDLTSENPTATD